jgi:undecaprenyl-diphosphatase
VDGSLYRSINRLAAHTGWAHTTFRIYAKDGIVVFAVLLIAGWLLERRGNDIVGVAGVIGAGVAALLAVGLVQLIGNLVDRARPYTVMPSSHLLVAKTADFSFPSDHATAVGAIAVGLFLVRRRLGIVACVLALVMAFARVYVGAHYPGDVVAGLLLGAVTAVLIRPLAVRLLVPLLGWVRGTPLGVVVAAERD